MIEINEQDLQTIWSWNRTVPEAVESCVHDSIIQAMRSQPTALAVDSWDGQWTYSELDLLSTRLAFHLIDLGVRANVIVPLIFEKSKWMPVAMIAVMKAGGASVAMGPTQPESRLRAIIQRVSPVVILCSADNFRLANRLTPHKVWTVDQASSKTLGVRDLPLPVVSPKDLFFILFTSGTTGTPKGVLITHGNFATAMRYQLEYFGYDDQSRIFDFSSYIFDAVWLNLVYGLSSGACLCIPSENERNNDIVGAMGRLRVTHADLTPSVAGILPISVISQLRTLIVGGEQLQADDARRWGALTTVRNCYGPSETTPTAMIASITPGGPPYNGGIGRGVGLNTWIMDPRTKELVPIGQVGELVLEGPLVGPGYLEDVEKTQSVFLDGLPFLRRGAIGHPGRHSRLYLTGDLVRYNEDGSIMFVGRKDAQVKIHGQRVELSEVELAIRAALPNDTDIKVAVEYVVSKHTSKSMLLAFLAINPGHHEATDDTQAELRLRAQATQITSGLDEKLALHLPAYMIPSVYIPLRRFPVTTTGKLDRKQLRQIGEQLTPEQLMSTGPYQSNERRQPRTEMEQRIQRLWSTVLGLPAPSIGIDDSFLRLGGNSIDAIKLVGLARDEALAFSVADVLQSRRLSSLANVVRPVATSERTVSPFSLLGLDSPIESLQGLIAGLCGTIAATQIQDAFPCTPLQEGLLALTARTSDAYVARHVFELQPTVDKDHFRVAWEQVVASTPILRTRIVDLPGEGLVQTTVHEGITWRSAAGLIDYIEADQKEEMGLGSPLVRFGLVEDARTDSSGERYAGSSYFVWTIHHALYDGWSMPRMLERLDQAYHGDQCRPAPPFQHFVEHVVSVDQEAVRDFWTSQLGGLEAPVFPALPSPDYQPRSNEFLDYHIPEINWPRGNATASSILRAAWAMVIASYADSEDVVYGATVTGRQAAVSDIEEIVGPTITTVPIRLHVGRQKTIEQFLDQVQLQSSEMIAFEQTGLQHIRRISSEASQACDFQSILIVQPEDNADVNPSRLLSIPGDDSEEDDLFAAFDTYAVTIVCHVKPHGVRVRINYDSRVLGAWQMKNLANHMEHVLQQLCSPAADFQASLINTMAAGRRDLQDIWNWNAVVPESLDQAVHEGIMEMSRKQPDAVAVNAWDGDWTYAQLDTLSTLLALNLVRSEVRSNAIVPLIFEKSKWMPVVMLAVMKAGGASAAIDPSQPEDRVRAILKQAQPRLILCSPSNLELAERLSSGVAMVVDEAQMAAIEKLALSEELTLPTVQPADLLYVVFTSGTTGIPKGVQVTHLNFSSAMRHQASYFGYNSQSRVFDFSSYSFDSTWVNITYALTGGACLCIPSETERKDTLAGQFKRFAITHADLTPSIARLLPLSVIARLRTMVLGGEQLQTDDARRWGALTVVRNMYGPSETSPTATIASILPGGAPYLSGSIGKGVGLCTWVVDAATGQTLVPVGSVGELVLEGSLVGPGYLNDPVKTAAVFVDTPEWLAKGSPVGHAGRRGRVYKTGDLVRYCADGSLVYIGRKDTQVKVNGQRVELGEIEERMNRYQPIRQSAALLPKTGTSANRLVALFSLRKTLGSQASLQLIQLDKSVDAESRNHHVVKLRAILENEVPLYMIPSVWIVLEDLPLNTSGKLNTKALQSWLSSMDQRTFAAITEEPQQSAAAPQTDIERLLRDACAEILAVPMTRIDVSRSFVMNGGDSISAMRLVSHCTRVVNLFLSVSSVLKSKSLAQLALTVKVDSIATAPMANLYGPEEFSSPFELSPIQQWFFQQSPAQEINLPERYANQSFCLKVNQSLSAERVSTALTKIVNHHSMLRARFEKTAYGWTKQRVLPPGAGTFPFRSVQLQNAIEISSLVRQRHRQINFEEGPVFTADLCAVPKGQYLVLIAHHLVIDLVSWRIIIEDLEILLKGGSLQPSLPFRTWNKLQMEKVVTSQFDPDNILSTKFVDNNLAFWNFTSSTPNSETDHEFRTVHISEDITSLLLHDANAALNTEPVDLLLAAVWIAFFQTFSSAGRQGLTIFNEGHGRESWDGAIDLSRTVGWFTTASPIHVMSSTNPVHIARFVKDARRRLPSNGWAYFASRFFNSKGRAAFDSHNSTMEVEFNYHGQFQELERDESFFERVRLDVPDEGPEAPAASLFGIEASIADGRAQYSVSANRHISHQGEIADWIDRIGPSLSELCTALVALPNTTTLCDYQFVNLDYKGLEELHKTVLPQIQSLNRSSVVELLPSSPTVNGMLLGQLKNSQYYKTSEIYEIAALSLGGELRLEDLANAWQRVVMHQPSLRTVFVEGLNESEGFTQLLLDELFRGEVVCLRSQDETAAMSQFENLPPLNYQQLKPPHRLTLCQTENGKIFCQIEMSHGITDGASNILTIQDWATAYRGSLPSADLLRTSREFAQALLSTPEEEKINFWKHKLAGIEPIYFPRLTSSPVQGPAFTISTEISGNLFDQIQNFCEIQSITPASIYQTAWALTLAAYTGTDSVCFGYLASGRDLPIPGLEQSIGAYTNMMICRLDGLRNASVDLVKQTYAQLIEDLDYQHCSLADIQHEIGLPSGQMLFNNIFTFQRVDDKLGEIVGNEQIMFRNLGGRDPTEYDLVVEVSHGSSHSKVFLDCMPSCLTKQQASRVLSLLMSILHSVLAEGHAVASDSIHVDDKSVTPARQCTISNEDLEDVWAWNANLSESIKRCVHDLIAETVHSQPDSLAVSAWDGELTYRKLERLSTQWAYHLVGLGVTASQNKIIPLCFEKSKWTSVAMLAVMKTGAASVALDPSLPRDRLRAIVDQTQPVLILSSVANFDLSKSISQCSVVTMGGPPEVGDEMKTVALPHVSTSALLYIVFTSGSTGIPKGVLITHANFSSAIHYQHHMYGYGTGSRV
jgi:amino acid adenylation domain-containing protein/non-ribosomal peptide synthase protein (TIGR01720 family)